MAPAELFDVGDPEQRITNLNGVVQECEGSFTRNGGEPERKLGHFRRDRVLVDAVQAVVDDLPPRKHHLVLGGLGSKIGQARGEAALAWAVLGNGLDKPG